LVSKERRTTMKTALQTCCVILVSMGIAIEAHYGADLGFILISAGSLAFAVSTKIHKRQ